MPRTPRIPRDVEHRIILDASRKLFASSGFHRSTMDQISSAAGVSKPVLYRHFESKVDLYSTVLDDCISCFQPRIAGTFSAQGTPRDRTEKTIMAFTDLVLEHRDIYDILFRTDVINHSEIDTKVQTFRTGIVEGLTQTFLQDSRFTDPVVCRMCAQSIVSATLSAVENISTAEASARPTLITVLYRLIWGAIYLMDQEVDPLPSAPLGSPTEPDRNGLG